MSHLRRHCSIVRYVTHPYPDELTTFCCVVLLTCSYAVGATGLVCVWSDELTTGNACSYRGGGQDDRSRYCVGNACSQASLTTARFA